MNHFKSPSIFFVVLLLGLTLGCAQATKEEKNLKEQVEALKKQVESLQSTASLLAVAKDNSDLVVAVVEKAIPSVVSIHSAKIVEAAPYQNFNPFEELFGWGNPQGPQNPQQKRPEKQKQQGLGSGVIVSKDGLVVTNHHVAGEADEIKVTLTDGRTFEAKIVGTDKLSDVALLQIKDPKGDLPFIQIGNSEKLKIGETVIAIGSPFGYSNTVTKGIVSARGRQVGLNSYENYIQTDASINPGNSGGALVNLKGELIGVNTAIASRTGGSHGIGFAIPVTMVMDIIADLKKDGTVTRGYLGVYLQEIDENLVTALGLKDTKGALVSKIIEGSPAQEAGFQEMDIVVELEGVKINDVNQLRNEVARLDPGKTYKFKIIREGQSKMINAKMGERDQEQVAGEEGSEKTNKNYGLTLENIDQRLQYQYRLNKAEGVVVTEVEVGSAADEAGFQEGDLILEVNKKKIKTVSEFAAQVKKSQKKNHVILVERRGNNVYLGLKLSK